MTEQQYPIHLRKIGEPVIAQFLEDLMEEIDTHEKMYLELCAVKRERDALLGAVPRDEHESLLKRFQHLLESDFIRSFDEYDPKTGTYKRDISEADKIALVRRGRWEDANEWDEWYAKVYKCSLCGGTTLGCRDEYCSNCGAKMEVKLDE